MANTSKDLQRNVRREERSKPYKKSAGVISEGRLFSVYLVSAIIVGLCIYEFFKGDEILGGNVTYAFLGVLAIAASIIITLRNNEAKKASAHKRKK